MTELNRGRGKEIYELRHLVLISTTTQSRGGLSSSQTHRLLSTTRKPRGNVSFVLVSLQRRVHACVRASSSRLSRGCLGTHCSREDEPGTRTPSRVVRWMETLAGCRRREYVRAHVSACVYVSLSLSLFLCTYIYGLRCTCVSRCAVYIYPVYMRVHVYMKGGSVREGKRACLAHWRLTVGPTDRSVRRYQRRGAVWVAEPGAQASGRHRQYPTAPSRTDSRLWTIDRSVSVTKICCYSNSVTKNVTSNILIPVGHCAFRIYYRCWGFLFFLFFSFFYSANAL